MSDHARTLTDVARERVPHQDGVCLDTGTRRWTLGQLLDDTGHLAGGLSAAGVRRGDRVALAAGAIPEQFMLLLAVNRLGAVHVPLNSQWLAAEVRHVIDEVRPRVIVVDERRAPAILEALTELDDLQVFMVSSAGSPSTVRSPLSCQPFESLWAPEAFEDDLGLPEDDAVIFYTSGTTGRPKGAVWSHSCLTYNSLAWSRRFGVGAGDVGFGAYDGRGSALAVGLLGPMLAGARLIAGERIRRGWLGMAQTVLSERVTFWMMAPAMISLVAREARKAGIDQLPSVRLLILGSAAAAPIVMETAASIMPNAEIFNCYGATEGHISACSGPELSNKPGAVGRPLPGTEIRIVDDAGRDAATGDVGRVIVRGPGVMARYIDQPLLTDSVLCDGWWHTGDLGYLDDEGCLFLAGRESESINTGGWTVDPVEIENVIAGLDGVERVAVIGRSDPVFGQTVVAYVQPSTHSALTGADVERHCSQQLAHYKRPRRIEFRSELPVNATMKVQKRLIHDD